MGSFIFRKKKLKKTKKKIQYWCSRFPSSVIVFLSSLSVIDLEYRVIDETRFARLKNESRKDGMLIICLDGIFFFPRECGDVDVTRKKNPVFLPRVRRKNIVILLSFMGRERSRVFIYLFFYNFK